MSVEYESPEPNDSVLPKQFQDRLEAAQSYKESCGRITLNILGLFAIGGALTTAAVMESDSTITRVVLGTYTVGVGLAGCLVASELFRSTKHYNELDTLAARYELATEGRSVPESLTPELTEF